jgi:hypothetical protein
VVVHFDADLGSSTTEALAITERMMLGKINEAYFLFDDWGCHPDEVPDSFYGWLHQDRKALKITATRICSTRYTRYFKMEFNW